MRRACIIARGVLLGVALLGARVPLADAEPKPSPEGLSGLADEKARQTFREGIEAFDRRDFEAARVAFLQTFALKPAVPVVRRNLGLAEIFSGHYLDGARRLARVIHTTDDGTAEDRARMLDSLKKAEAHLERITLEVNVEGADILIDEIDLGASPLPFVWYVAPGEYSVSVTKDGFAPFTEARVARAGGAQHLRVTLTSVPQPATMPFEAPPAAPLDVPHAGLNPWIIAAGAVVTAGGLGVGVGFSLAASSNARKVDRLGYELGATDCRSRNPSCAELLRAADEHDRQVGWAAASFVTAGVAGIGTLVYGLLAGSSPREGATSPSLVVAPGFAFDLDPDGAGVRWRGAF